MSANLSLATFLQNELTLLANESKKRNPEIKEAAEKLLLQIRVVKDSRSTPSPTIIGSGRVGVDPLSLELRKSPDTLKPFFQSCDTKNSKLVAIAVQCLQRLAAQQAVPIESVSQVFKYLIDNAKDQQEQQLKILQLSVSVLTNYSIHGQTVFDTLLLCWKLVECKSTVVSNTAAATLRQLAVLVFEKAAGEQSKLTQTSKAANTDADVAEYNADDTSNDDQTHNDLTDINDTDAVAAKRKSTEQLADTLPLFQKDAFLLLQDLCRLTSGEKALYLQCPKFNKTLGFELLEGILTNGAALLKSVHAFTVLLKSSVCPLILKAISEQADFSTTVHLVRLVTILVKSSHVQLSMESEIFLTMFSKVLELDATPLWHKVVLLESFKSIVSDEATVVSLFQTFDAQQQASNVLRDLITTFYKALMSERVLSLLQPAASDAKDPATLEPSRILCMDYLDRTEPPALSDNYFAYLAAACALGIGDSIAHHSQNDNTAANTKYALLLSSYPGLLSCYSFLLGANLRDGMYQQVLASCERVSLALNMLPSEAISTSDDQQAAPRDAFLYCLCRVAVPSQLLSDEAMQFEKLKVDKPHPSPIRSAANAAAMGSNLKALSATVAANSVILTERQVWTCHVILGLVASPSPVLFDMKTWYLVMDTLQIADMLVRVSKVAPVPVKQTSVAAGLTSAASSLVGTAAGVIANFSGRNADSYTGNQIPTPSASGSADSLYLQLVAAIRKLFEANSRQMQFEALDPFLRALCQLALDHSSSNLVSLFGSKIGSASVTAQANSGTASAGQSKSADHAFALAKLFEVVMNNMGRLVAPELQLAATQAKVVGPQRAKLWEHVCDTAIVVAQDPQTLPGVREQATAFLGDILISAAQVRHEATELRVLTPLHKFIAFLWTDENKYDFAFKIAQSGLETLDKVLQCGGQCIKQGWELVFDTLKSAVKYSLANPGPNSKQFVKTAFPSLQLIVADFLSLLNDANVRLCLDTALAFGRQNEDLNIALTAVGFIWKISDSVLKHRLSFSPSVADQLWMQSLDSLVALSSDQRADLRNSAVQTLFRTISLNGDQLSLVLWDECIVRILFPLLQAVLDSSAALPESAARPADKEGMLVHHSRDSQPKLWDETKALAINGVAKTIQDRLSYPAEMAAKTSESVFNESFLDIWKTFMSFLLKWILCPSQEVSINGSKCLTQVLVALSKTAGKHGAENASRAWDEAWKCWNEAITLLQDSFSKRVLVNWSRDSSALFDACSVERFIAKWQLEGALLNKGAALITPQAQHIYIGHVFSSEVVTQLALVVSELLPFCGSQLGSMGSLKEFLAKVEFLLLYHKAKQPDDVSQKYNIAVSDEKQLLPTQSAVFDNIIGARLLKIAGGDDFSREDVLEILLDFWCRIILWPLALKSASATVAHEKYTGDVLLKQVDINTYVSLGKKVTLLVSSTLAGEPELSPERRLLERTIEGLGWPLQFKYALGGNDVNGAQSYWKTASTTLFGLCTTSVARFAEDKECSVELKALTYAKLAWAIEGLLLPTTPAPASISVEEIESDEALDLKWLDCIQTMILQFMVEDGIPRAIPSVILSAVLRGSKLYLTHEEVNCQGASKAILGDSEDKARFERERARNKALVGTTLASDVVPVLREKFAAACLNLLFTLCGDNALEPTDRWFKIAEITCPVLLKRCSSVLQDYIHDKPIFGRCPLPRMRSDEISFILSNLVRLNLRPGVAKVIYKTMNTDSTSLQGQVRNAILAGSSAHLFLLYSLLIECLGLGAESLSVSGAGAGANATSTSTKGSVGAEEAVLDMFKACLRRIGKDLGIETPPY